MACYNINSQDSVTVETLQKKNNKSYPILDLDFPSVKRNDDLNIVFK